MDLIETLCDTPIGPVLAAIRGREILSLALAPHRNSCTDSFPLFSETLQRWFDTGDGEMPFTLSPTGTPFQQRVWSAIRSVPRGETRTYGELAQLIGKPTAVRAVAQACGANPILLFIPCHRIVAKDGLGGFSAPIEIKKALLARECLFYPLFTQVPTT